MKAVHSIIIILAIIIATLIVKKIFLTNSSAEIKKIIYTLVDLNEIKKKENPIEIASKAKAIAYYFSKKTYIDLLLKNHGKVIIESYDSLLEHLALLRNRVHKLNATIDPPDIELIENTAILTTTATVRGKHPYKKGDFEEILPIKVEFIKENSKWKINKVLH